MRMKFLFFVTMFFCVMMVQESVFGQGVRLGRRTPASPGGESPLKKKLSQVERQLARVEKMLRTKSCKRIKKDAFVMIKDARLTLKEIILTAKPMHPAPGRTVGSKVSVSGREGKSVEVNVNLQVPPAVGVEEGRREEPHPTGMPMKVSAFRKLVSEISKQAFGDEKLIVFKQASKENFFTVAQIKQILKFFSFSDNMLKALRVVKDRIIDRENLFQIYSSFVHSSDKEEAKKILEGGE